MTATIIYLSQVRALRNIERLYAGEPMVPDIVWTQTSFDLYISARDKLEHQDDRWLEFMWRLLGEHPET